MLLKELQDRTERCLKRVGEELLNIIEYANTTDTDNFTKLNNFFLTTFKSVADGYYTETYNEIFQEFKKESRFYPHISFLETIPKGENLEEAKIFLIDYYNKISENLTKTNIMFIVNTYIEKTLSNIKKVILSKLSVNYPDPSQLMNKDITISVKIARLKSDLEELEDLYNSSSLIN